MAAKSVQPMEMEDFCRIMKGKCHWLEGMADALGNVPLKHAVEDIRKLLKAVSYETVKKQFDTIWEKLSNNGSCDGLGGMEYKRVLRTWISSGQNEPLEVFITREANLGPDGDYSGDPLNEET